MTPHPSASRTISMEPQDDRRTPCSVADRLEQAGQEALRQAVSVATAVLTARLPLYNVAARNRSPGHAMPPIAQAMDEPPDPTARAPALDPTSCESVAKPSILGDHDIGSGPSSLDRAVCYPAHRLREAEQAGGVTVKQIDGEVSCA